MKKMKVNIKKKIKKIIFIEEIIIITIIQKGEDHIIGIIIIIREIIQIIKVKMQWKFQIKMNKMII